MIRDAARDFAKTELLPGVIERDETQTFPKEQIQVRELGFMGIWLTLNMVALEWTLFHTYCNGRIFKSGCL